MGFLYEKYSNKLSMKALVDRMKIKKNHEKLRNILLISASKGLKGTQGGSKDLKGTQGYSRELMATQRKRS